MVISKITISKNAFPAFCIYFFLSNAFLFGNLSYHSLILKSDGSLHAFGRIITDNWENGTTTNRNTPTQILILGSLKLPVDITHSLILKTDGSLHTFGRNNYGQLGDGTTRTKTPPLKFSLLEVAQIAAGYYHSLILKSDGSLHSTGYNYYGQLGMVQIRTEIHPHKFLLPESLKLPLDIAIHLFSNLMAHSILLVLITTDNWGMVQQPTKIHPTQILASGVSQIAAGRYHSLILKTDGSLHTFGYNIMDNWEWNDNQQKHTHSNSCFRSFSNCRRCVPLSHPQIRWIAPCFW